MPARYEAIRDALIAKGIPVQQAKGQAARIFNGTRKPGTPPVTRSSDAKGGK